MINKDKNNTPVKLSSKHLLGIENLNSDEMLNLIERSDHFANLITNTIAPYSGLLGYITSFDYSYETGDGFYFSDQNNLFFRAYKLTFGFSVLHEGVVGAINGRFFNFKQDYPYRTDEEFGINTDAVGTPINRAVAEENILGGG